VLDNLRNVNVNIVHAGQRHRLIGR
jgi:hypothetical protein